MIPDGFKETPEKKFRVKKMAGMMKRFLFNDQFLHGSKNLLNIPHWKRGK